MSADPCPIDDATMRQYIERGYFTVQSSLPNEFHAGLVDKLDAMLASEGNWGNNVLPRVPEIQQVFQAPEVRGALASILGPNYVMHPHRYAHCNVPGSAAQKLHKDSTHYSGDVDIRHHRSRWAMAFYYPQDVTEDLGPTSILPGTQYYEEESHDPDNAEITLTGKAGTLSIVHFDVWHRATANSSGKRRWMLKFLFARTEEPRLGEWKAASPRWSNEPNDTGSISTGRPSSPLSPSSPLAPLTRADLAAEKHGPAWRTLWHWIQGEAPPKSEATCDERCLADCTEALSGEDPAERRRAANCLGLMRSAATDAIPALATALRDPDEALRLNASYALGMVGAPAIPALIAEVRRGTEIGRRHAACALALIGEPAVPALLQALDAPDWEARAAIIDALGEIGPVTPQVVPALVRALGDESDWVRRHAADAAGTIGPAAAEAVPGLIRLLKDEHAYVRINAATALMKLGPAAEDAVPALIEALNDRDRYTRAFAGKALRRIGTAPAREALLDLLETARWCPITSLKSPY